VCVTCSRWSNLAPSALRRCFPGDSTPLVFLGVAILRSVLFLHLQQHPHVHSLFTTSTSKSFYGNYFKVFTTRGLKFNTIRGNIDTMRFLLNSIGLIRTVMISTSKTSLTLILWLIYCCPICLFDILQGAAKRLF